MKEMFAVYFVHSLTVYLHIDIQNAIYNANAVSQNVHIHLKHICDLVFPCNSFNFS